MTKTTLDERGSIDGDAYDVLIVGGGVAGLMAATFTARAGLETLLANAGESILRRNAHLENVPGFPLGVNPRLFADMLQSQTTHAGANLVTGRVITLDGSLAETFTAKIDRDDGQTYVHADRVLVASWADTSYLEGVDVAVRTAGSKQYVETDEHGRSTVEGIYAAGRITERYHQTVIAAGDGAETAITLIHDSDVPFYNDWVAPEGYFTDRGREVPPGCEEIDGAERRARERASMAAMTEYFAEPHGDRQRTHPSLSADALGRVPENGESRYDR